MASRPGDKIMVGKVNEKNWEDIMRQNYMVLSRIRPGYIVDILFQECVLNEEDRDEIRCLTTPRKQATRLLDLLPSKGYKSFVSFLKMLENEYPDIYQEVTGKEAVKKPGYNRLDRWSSFLEQMPEVFSRLREEMKNSKTLADSLQQLQQSVEFMKQEKAELERELEVSRIELTDLPQLKQECDVLLAENVKLRNENHDRTRETLACIHERDRAERKCREFQGDIQKFKSELGKLRSDNETLRNEVEMVTMERDKEKRKTRLQGTCRSQQASLDACCPESTQNETLTDSVRLQLEQEIDILLESKRELQEEIANVAQELLDTRTRLHQVEDNLRNGIAEREKSAQALANAEENLENLKRRCSDTWHQVDELRQEKDKAMESQHFYLSMYNKVSLERDRLSSQLKKLESQYDDTKIQLDKLKQDMRSSLKSSSDSMGFNDTVHQWIKRLEEERLFGTRTGTSSSGISEQNYLFPGDRTGLIFSGSAIPASVSKATGLERTDTVNAVIGDPPSNECLDPVIDGIYVAEKRKKNRFDHGMVSREGKTRLNCSGTLPKTDSVCADSYTEGRCESSKSEETPTEFYIRCDQDYDAASDEELTYRAGDFLMVIDVNPPGDKKDVWLAVKVEQSTGNPCTPKVEGIIKSDIRFDRPPSKATLNNESLSNHLSRRCAVKPKKIKPEGYSTSVDRWTRFCSRSKSSSDDTGLYTLVMKESVDYKRPILFSGQRSVSKSLSAVLASQGKCACWFDDDARSEDFEKKLAMLVKQDQRVILPPGSLHICHTFKLYPICIKLEYTDTKEHLTSLLGNLEEDTSSQDDCKELMLTATLYRTFTISKIHTPTREELISRMMNMVEEMQMETVWRPTQKLPGISLCSSP